HSDNNQIKTGANFECGGRYARIAPGGYDREAHADTERKATAPAAIAAHDTVGLSATGVEISTDSKTINAPSDDCPFPFWLRTGLLVGRTRSHSQRLFPFERVFDTADGVLNLALNLVGLALRLQLCVTGRLADRLLHCAFDLLRRSNDPVLVH